MQTGARIIPQNDLRLHRRTGKDPLMSDATSPPTAAALSPAAAGNLELYELQKPFVEPMLRLCRLGNTALDAMFYDVGALTEKLLAQHTVIDTGASRESAPSTRPPQVLDL